MAATLSTWSSSTTFIILKGVRLVPRMVPPMVRMPENSDCSISRHSPLMRPE